MHHCEIVQLVQNCRGGATEARSTALHSPCGFWSSNSVGFFERRLHCSHVGLRSRSEDAMANAPAGRNLKLRTIVVTTVLFAYAGEHALLDAPKHWSVETSHSSASLSQCTLQPSGHTDRQYYVCRSSDRRHMGDTSPQADAGDSPICTGVHCCVTDHAGYSPVAYRRGSSRSRKSYH